MTGRVSGGRQVRSLARAAALGLRLVGLVALAALAVSCGPKGPTGEGFELVGYVHEARGPGSDGQAIPNASVRLEMDTGRVAETTTASDGRYRVFIVSDTPFGEVSARAAGFHESRQSVYFDTPSHRIDLRLPREAASAP